MCAAPPSAPLRPTSVVGTPLTRLAESAGAAVPGGASGADPLVTGVTLRAQQVLPGDLFAALPGARAHGAAFTADAAARGAVAVLTDPAGAAAVAAGGPGSAGADLPVLVTQDPRAVLGEVAATVYGRPSEKTAVIGITGTSGKTTTCYLLEAALAAGGLHPGLVGTVQIRIDGTATPSSLTTPEAPDLQALFAVMVERGARAVAMEVSSHALSLGRVAGTRFAVGGFTNLSQDHLDFHPDMESYFRAKALLFDGRADTGVVQIDDEHGRRLAAEHPGVITVSGTDRPEADWAVLAVEAAAAGHQQVRVRAPGERTVSFDLALPGAFNVANAVLALACVSAGTEVPLPVAASALSSVVVPGRMERVDAGQDFLVLVDYAHKPAAVAAVLEAASRGMNGRLIVVLGAGGDRDPGKRPAMGEQAAVWADLVVITDDNPRSESPAAIRRAVLAGATHPATPRRRPGGVEIREVGDRHEAIRVAVGAAGTGDVVVIAGKGHEEGQDVAGVVHPFSDRLEALAALTELAERSGRSGRAGDVA
nr:UDP-N-acetylmuramoyl-L-alanyl-D-glutamate--2,6-diaminopimelate ligase [Nakamurella alba]